MDEIFECVRAQMFCFEKFLENKEGGRGVQIQTDPNKNHKPVKKNRKKKTKIIECVWMSFYKNRSIRIRFQIDFSKPIQTKLNHMYIFLCLFVFISMIWCVSLLLDDTYFFKYYLLI